nr:uncharacterized protein LOC124813370 [Hydra vulgaris]
MASIYLILIGRMSVPKITRFNFDKKESKFSLYLGGCNDVNLLEVSAIRDILRIGLLIQECLLIEKDIDKRLISVRELSVQLADLVLQYWTRSNVFFKFLVVINKISLVQKIELAWNKLSNISKGKTV